MPQTGTAGADRTPVRLQQALDQRQAQPQAARLHAYYLPNVCNFLLDAYPAITLYKRGVSPGRGEGRA